MFVIASIIIDRLVCEQKTWRRYTFGDNIYYTYWLKYSTGAQNTCTKKHVNTT